MTEIEKLISQIEIFPSKLSSIISKLSPDQLQLVVINWTIAQNIHHMVDSHINSYIRIKLALTEDSPTIKPYDESLWSTLPDSMTLDVSTSLAVIEGIHKRICLVLRSLTDSDWQKTFTHPELNPSEITIATYLKVFASHGYNHLDNILSTLEKNNIAV